MHQITTYPPEDGTNAAQPLTESCKSDGGQVYRAPVSDSGIWPAPGISLRDKFALEAMKVLIARGEHSIPDTAYAYADAMIEARDR